MKRISRRWISVSTILAMVGALMALAPPALAQPEEVQLFMPDGDFSDGAKNVLADHFDGTDERAHLTAVADDEAEEAAFYNCAETVDTLEELDTTTDTCEEIGRDTSPRQPGGEDNAFETTWDIEADDPDQTIVVQACEDGELPEEDEADGIEDDCVGDLETGIELDDGDDNDDEDDEQLYSTGEMTEVCPEEDPDDCDSGDFEDFDHGDELPTDGFTLRFTTDESVDDAFACLDEDADAVTEPEECEERAEADDIDDDDDETEWEASFDGGDYSDNDELDVMIGCDAADCMAPGGSDALIFDEHYTVPDEDADGDGDGGGAVDDVVLTFREQSGDDCDDPSREETNEFDGDTLVSAQLDGCIFEDGDEVFEEETSFVLDGVGGFTSCEGTRHDHDDDGDFEHCHVDPDNDNDDGSNDIYDVTINNEEDDDPESGSAVVTFCTDPEQSSGSTGHGCADELAGDTDTATKFYSSDAEHVHAVFDGTDLDDCHTGSQTKSNVEGETDSILICTMDEDENAASTTPASAEAHVEVTSSNPAVVAVSGSANRETPGSGFTTVEVTAVGPGTATIDVELVCEDESEADCPAGGILDEDSVTKTVAGLGECENGIDDDGDGLIDGADPDCAESGGVSETHVPERIRFGTDVTIDRIGRRFTGNVFSERRRCRVARLVRVKKARPGRDRFVGADFTNRNGVYRVRKRRANGRFYAVAVRKAFTARNGDRIICLRGRSRNLNL